MAPDIGRPAAAVLPERLAVIGKERAARLLKARQVARHCRHEAVGGLAVRARARPLPSSERIAASVRRLSAFDAPPGCADSQAQCRGSKVTSRATTPSFGRPRPGDFRLIALRSMSRLKPGQDLRIGATKIKVDNAASLVVEDQQRRSPGRARRACLAAMATSASGPAAMALVPWKAILGVDGDADMNWFLNEAPSTRIKIIASILPG